MSFVETERTAMDAELARQTLLRLKFEDESRRQAEVRMSIEEEAAKSAEKVIAGHLYEPTQEEIDLNNKLIRLEYDNPIVIAARDRLHNLIGIYDPSHPRASRLGRYGSQADILTHELKIKKEEDKIQNEKNKIKSALKEIQENKREEIRLEFISLATERERAKRLEESNIALETIRHAEAAQESERLRIIQEEAEQREIEFKEYTVRMVALQAEQEEALRLAEANRQLGVQSQKTFNVEAPQPVMASMSIPTPMLLIGGATALLLLARRK